jgi:hypothetical protein
MVLDADNDSDRVRVSRLLPSPAASTWCRCPRHGAAWFSTLTKTPTGCGDGVTSGEPFPDPVSNCYQDLLPKSRSLRPSTWGCGGRWFESSRSDHFCQRQKCLSLFNWVRTSEAVHQGVLDFSPIRPLHRAGTGVAAALACLFSELPVPSSFSSELPVPCPFQLKVKLSLF